MDEVRDLRWPFDADLGELCEGHHVVALGIGTNLSGDELHYLFKPGMTTKEQEGRPFFWYWSLRATDDAGTAYTEFDGGAFAEDGGEATHGTRDIGGHIPDGATRLTLKFTPADGWKPRGSWVREITVDLLTNAVTVRR